VAVEEPTNLPRWADNPPAGPPDTITEPSEPEKDAGWQAAQPYRQYDNWFKNLAYQWIRFLSSVWFRWSDIGPDFHIPDSATSPTTGAGLTGTSGAVTAMIEGRRVVGVSEARLFGASTDTYIDLDRDGVWTYVQVANGAGEPALTANSIRVFKLVTDGADRTAVTSYVSEQVKTSKPWRFGKGIELGADFLTSAAAAAIARIIAKYRNNVDATYTPLYESTASTGTNSGLRIYAHVPAAGAGAHRSIVLTVNARWDPTGPLWYSDDTAAISSKWTFGQPGTVGDVGLTQHQIAPSASWADNAWDDGPAPWLPAGVRLGNDLDPETPHIIARGDDDGERCALFFEQDIVVNANPPRIYLVTGGGTASFGPCMEFTQNARWDVATTRWVRDAAGRATKFAIGAHGIQLLNFDATSTANWVDTISGATWKTILSVASEIITAASFQDVDVVGTLTGDIADVNSLLAVNATVDGTTTSGAFAWDAPRAGVVTVSGARLTKTNGGAITVPNPGTNAFTGVLKAIKNSGAATEDAGWWQFDVPNGVTISSCVVNGLFTPSAATLEATLVRAPNSGGAPTSLRVGGGGVTALSNGAAGDLSLTLDQNLDVDNNLYTYYLWIHGADATYFDLYRFEVHYTTMAVRA
jgi:hypothetical protein